MYIESVDNRTFILIFKLKVYKKSSKISNKWILRRFFVYTLIKNQYYLYFAKGLWIQTAIYELEENLKPKHFLRISKSSLVNLMKIISVKSALGGRFSVVLSNGEEIIISRKYVSELKKVLRGDEV